MNRGHTITHLRSEIRLFLQIGLPLSVAYLAEYAMFITTKMVVGKLGYEQLAAVGIAGDLSFEVLVVLMGLLSVIGVLAAQAHGAGDPERVCQSVRQGVIVSTLIGLIAWVFVWNLDVLLVATNQDPAVIAFAIPFLHGLSGMVLPVLWFAVFRNFVVALSRPKAIMIITIGAVFVNYLLTVWFVHGGFGLDPMGLFGAGLSLAVVNWAMFLCLLVYIFATPYLRSFGILSSRWSVNRALIKEILHQGIPVAGLTLLEAGLFIAASILSGLIGAKTLAAFEIVMSWAGIPFVIAIGLAEATMVRVAHAAGQRNMPAARHAGLLGMGLGVVILSALIVIPVAYSNAIIQLFITPEDPGFVDVSALASLFLMIAALFQIFDGLQAIAARALRGLKDNIMPLWIAGFGYWVLGIGGGSILAFKFDYGGAGLWWGLALGLGVTSCLLVWRFHRITRPETANKN